MEYLVKSSCIPSHNVNHNIVVSMIISGTFRPLGLCNGGFPGGVDGEESLRSLCCHRRCGTEPPASGSGQPPRSCHRCSRQILAVPCSVHHTAEFKEVGFGCGSQVSY